MRTGTLRQEMRLGFAETNARIAESNARTAETHARIAEGSAKTAQAILDINTRLSTIIDAIADLRREYSEHTHPE
jgi:uncharacterized protein YjbK